MNIKQLSSAKAALVFVSLIMSTLCILSANGIYTYLFSELPSRSEGLIMSAVAAIFSAMLLCVYLWIAISHKDELSLKTVTLTSLPSLIIVILTIYIHMLDVLW